MLTVPYYFYSSSWCEKKAQYVTRHHGERGVECAVVGVETVYKPYWGSVKGEIEMERQFGKTNIIEMMSRA